MSTKKIPYPVKEKKPAKLKHSTPGTAQALKDLLADFVVEGGSSSVKKFLPVKEKDLQSHQKQKKLNSLKRKLWLTVIFFTKTSTKPAKRPYTWVTQKKAIENKAPVPLVPKKKITKNECCFVFCGKKCRE